MGGSRVLVRPVVGGSDRKVLRSSGRVRWHVQRRLSNSLSVLGESGDDRADGVLRVREGRCVARSPRKLGAQAGERGLFSVGVGRHVTGFVHGALQSLDARCQLLDFEEGHLCHVSDVAHYLQLVQMRQVMAEVQHEVVLHCDVKGLHFVSAGAAHANSGVDRELSATEVVVLLVDLVNYAAGVNSVLVAGPVNFIEGLRVLASSIVEVEHGLELPVGLARRRCIRGSLEAPEPIVRQVTCYKRKNKYPKFHRKDALTWSSCRP